MRSSKKQSICRKVKFDEMKKQLTKVLGLGVWNLSSPMKPVGGFGKVAVSPSKLSHMVVIRLHVEIGDIYFWRL